MKSSEERDDWPHSLSTGGFFYFLEDKEESRAKSGSTLEAAKTIPCLLDLVYCSRIDL